MVPLEAEFGWNRTVISGAVAINIALFGLIGPFAASVMDRWGLRRVILAAVALLAVVRRADDAHAQRVGADAALGRARGHRNRRHVDGARSGRGDAVVRRAARPGDGRAVRGQCHRTAGLPAAARQPRRAARLASGRTRSSPARRRRVRHRAAASCATGRRISACSVRAAATGDRSIGARSHRSPPSRWRCARRAFWMLAGTFFVCGASTNGLIGTHLIAACHDYGISQVHSAQLLAVMGIFDILGTTASGLADGSLLEPPSAVRRTTRCAASRCCSCRTRWRTARAGWDGSRCSTGSTGWPRCRRPCV